jgi:hypothetical protein
MTDEELRTALSGWQPNLPTVPQFKSEVWQRISGSEPGFSLFTTISRIWNRLTRSPVAIGLTTTLLTFFAILAFSFTREIRCSLESETPLKSTDAPQLKSEINTQIKTPVGSAD